MVRGQLAVDLTAILELGKTYGPWLFAAGSGLATWLVNRRVNRESARVAGYSGDKQLDELLNDLQRTIARNGQEILRLQVRQDALDAHVRDLYNSIGAEPDDIQSRIKARLRTRRPNGEHNKGDR